MNGKREKIALILIFIVALALRLYPIAASLPHTYWHDENNYIEMALRFGVGNFKLASFSHGGLYQMILFIMYGAYYIFARLLGFIHSPAEFCLSYIKDPTAFFIIARAVSVFCGIGVILLTYLISAKAYNRRVGLVAGLFTAFSLLMFQMSFLAMADLPAVFILLAAGLTVLYSVERPADTGLYCLAALLVGLASACKYYASFGMITLYAAAYLKAQNSNARFSRFFYLIAGGSIFALLGFLIGMPFLIFNIAAFYKDSFVRMFGEYILRNPHKNTWLFYFTNHLPNGLGIPLESATILGVLYGLYKHSKKDILLLSLPIAYYLFIMNSSGFAYHLLPAIPFAFILAARFLDMIAERFFKGSLYVCLVLGILVVAPTFLDSVKYTGIMKAQDTRSEAKAWIEENIPQGAKILSEGYIQTLAIQGPPIVSDQETLGRDLEYIISRGGNGFLVNMRVSNFDKLYDGQRAYDIWKVDRLTKADVDRYGADYVIMVGTNDSQTEWEFLYYYEKDYFAKRKFLRDNIRSKYSLIKSIYPTDEFTFMFPHLMNYDYALIRKANILDLKYYKRGPKIDIFKRM